MKSIRYRKRLPAESILRGASAFLFAVATLCFMVYTTEQQHAHADSEDLGYDIASVNTSVTVGAACTLSGTETAPHTSTISNGLSSNGIGTTVLKTTCNDSGGYALYAIGYTDDTYGNTSLTYTAPDGVTTDSSYNIPTGTATSGNTSSWAVMLDTVPGSTLATIENGYRNYNVVPEDYTKVASLNTITDPGTHASGSSVFTTYQAYISPTQPAGTYTGKVKYTMVHPSTAPTPTFMQDVAKIKQLLVNEGDTIQAIDKRDGKAYWVAKLADGNIWMTQSLDTRGGTEITPELSDIPNGYVLPIANGFQSGNRLPEASLIGFTDSATAYVYNSFNTDETDHCHYPGCYSYYSWTAATAGSGVDISAEDIDAPYSICPKGWKLPNSRSTVAGNSDYYKLAVAYGMNRNDTFESTPSFFGQAGPGTTANFLLSGNCFDDSFGSGASFGYYWSSTSANSSSALHTGVYSSYIGTARISSRNQGYAVRCMAK